MKYCNECGYENHENNERCCFCDNNRFNKHKEFSEKYIKKK